MMKLKPFTRQPGGNAFTATRTPAFYGQVGYLAGLGRSSVAIADAMGPGVHPSYIRSTLRRWGIEHRPQALVMVPVSSRDRYAVNYRAEQAGLEPEEWLRRVVAAVAALNLFEVVTSSEESA